MALALLLLFGGCPRPTPNPSEADRSEVSDQIRRYRQVLLQPARVPPPSIAFELRSISQDGIVATARPLRAESAPWNRWEDGGPLLFNNRMALLFEVHVEAAEGVEWLPAETRLELNDSETVLAPARNTEQLLGDLLYWAFLEERWALEGDLVARTRAAGPFRAAYLPAVSRDGVLDGVVGFPLLDARDGVLLAEMHVVALRLTVGVEVEGEHVELSWVFD